MSEMFEEIAYHRTRIGELSLRRRRVRRDGEDIWEIMLDGGYLMSSRFVEGEIALAELALNSVIGSQLHVAVGGLGLGYTAKAVLENPRVVSLRVIEMIPEVIEWHHRALVPLGADLTSDPRCRLVEGDFFRMFGVGSTVDTWVSERLDAILVDIDHSTRHLIEAKSADFYGQPALLAMAQHLRRGGVFALWSSGSEDASFVAAMSDVFDEVRAERIEFPNPYRDEPAFNIVYLGTRR